MAVGKSELLLGTTKSYVMSTHAKACPGFCDVISVRGRPPEGMKNFSPSRVSVKMEIFPLTADLPQERAAEGQRTTPPGFGI